MNNSHEKINYVEFPAKDLATVKAFFSKVFGWSFVDYAPNYSAFSQTEAGLDGGFFQSNCSATALHGSALLVFYSEDLEKTQAKITQSGGRIVTPVFAFPGGRRFHFSDPNGNEYAVWSEQGA